MNIKFDSTSPKKSWEITDEKILYKGKEILLSEITYVTHHAFNKTSAYGWIFIGHGNSFFSPTYSLYYKESEIEQAEMVAAFLLRLIGKEQEADKVLKLSENRKKKNEIEEKERELRTKEFKKRCNVCGNVFCYRWDDLQKNKKLKKQENLNLVASFAGGLSGNYAAGAIQAQTADQAKSQIIDYDKCPSCGSRDLVDITDEEPVSINTQQSENGIASAADEIKKFKELLDMGVITQEEFDAKKKQLLGL